MPCLNLAGYKFMKILQFKVIVGVLMLLTACQRSDSGRTPEIGERKPKTSLGAAVGQANEVSKLADARNKEIQEQLGE